VRGRVIPLKLNPVPLAVICEIVRAVPPEFVSFSARVDVLPVEIFPKLRLVGLAASWPDVAPVPDSGTFSEALDAFDVIAMLPLTAVPEVGAKTILKVTLWPTLRVVGKVKPLAVKPAPVVLAAEIVTLDPPELVSVSVFVCELPTGTLPKARLVGLVASWPDVLAVPESDRVTVLGVRELRLRY